jgi:fucose permease
VLTIHQNPALMATKTSILIFYLRMSRNTQNILRIASYVTLGIVNVAGVVLTFMNAFQCSPVRAAYDPFTDKSKCLSIVTLYLCSAPVNIFTDLAILVLPIPVLTGMRLPSRQKIILVFTFSLGIFVTIIDVVRIYYLQKAAQDQIKAYDRLGTSADFAYNAATAFLWSAVEVNVGIICACIPTMKPLIKLILPSMITDPLRTRGSKDDSSSHINHSPLDRVPSGAATLAMPEPVAQIPGSMPHMSDVGNLAGGAGDGQPREVDMMDFLTTPDMAQGSMTRTHTARTTATDNTVYFGFVNMRRPKSMLKAKGWESFKYCTAVTILFFLWGFSYGLLNTLNNQIGDISKQSISQILGLSAAYFGAYFFGAMTVGQYVLRHMGFKATFITGLCIYGTGTLMFWPSAVLTSFPGFIISNFVVGFGLSVLETAANPFIALCGPSQSSEFRLLMAQGFQAIGTILSQLLAERVLFDEVVNNPNLIDVQWTYLAVALFTVILALLFYYMPLPEANDQDLQMQSDDLEVWHHDTVLSPKIRLIYFSLGAAVLAQFCYVAAQESMSVWIDLLLDQMKPYGGANLSDNNVVLVGHTAFAVGRFFFGGLCLVIRPRILLLVIFIGCIVFATLTVAVPTTSNGLAGFAIGLFFFEGPVFPLLFAMGLRGMGRRTKIAAAALTASAAGGAIFPFVMLAIQRLQNKTAQYSYSVVIALFIAGFLYPIYLNLVPKARNQVDPRPSVAGPPIRKMGRKLSVIVGKFGSFGNGKGSPGLPIVEHREGEMERQRGSVESEGGEAVYRGMSL